MNANLSSEIEDVIKRIMISELGISAAVLQTISSSKRRSCVTRLVGVMYKKIPQQYRNRNFSDGEV